MKVFHIGAEPNAMVANQSFIIVYLYCLEVEVFSIKPRDIEMWKDAQNDIYVRLKGGTEALPRKILKIYSRQMLSEPISGTKLHL